LSRDKGGKGETSRSSDEFHFEVEGFFKIIFLLKLMPFSM